MSARLLNYVLENSLLEGDDFALMLVIAHYSDAQGVCEMTVSKLAELARLSVIQAVDTLCRLEENGQIVMEAGIPRHAPCLLAIVVKPEEEMTRWWVAPPPPPEETDAVEEAGADLDDGDDLDNLAAMFA